MIRAFCLCAAAVLAAGCATTGSTRLLWEYTGGPYAQNIAAVLPDDKIPGTIYAALTNGEIQHSTNEGASWTRLALLPQRQGPSRLSQDPEDGSRLYAVGDAGALVSANRGKDWTGLHVAEPGTGVHVLTVDPWSPRTIFAGTQGRGIYKSTDGGATWASANDTSEVRLSTAEVYDIAVDLSKPDHVYAAATALGVIRSTDGGRTWTTLTEEFAATGTRITHVLLRKNSPGIFLYGTNGGSIVKSTNSGQSWIPSRNGLESDRILSLVAHPDNPDLVFAGTETGMIVSSDFGASWSSGGSDLPNLSMQLAIAGSGRPPTLYAYGSGIGLRASRDNGGTWRGADVKLGGSTVKVMTSDPSGDRILIAVGNTCLAGDAAGPGGWGPASTGITGGEIRSLAPDPVEAYVFYATTPAGIYQTTNGGSSWQPIARTLRISPMLFEPHPAIKTRIFAASEQGLFVSTDRGKSWTQPRPLGTRWLIHALTFSPTNAGVIYAATLNSGVIVTRDGGFTWETARYGLPANHIETVTLDDKDPDVLYAYTASGDCYRSINKGLEWNRYAPPWRINDTARVARDRFQPHSVIALVNNRELYYSPSGGGTWFKILDSDLKASVVGLQWNAASNSLYAGTVDKGVYKLSFGRRLKEILEE